MVYIYSCTLPAATFEITCLLGIYLSTYEYVCMYRTSWNRDRDRDRDREPGFDQLIVLYFHLLYIIAWACIEYIM